MTTESTVIKNPKLIILEFLATQGSATLEQICWHVWGELPLKVNEILPAVVEAVANLQQQGKICKYDSSTSFVNPMQYAWVLTKQRTNLSGDWTIVVSVEGGEVLAKDNGNNIQVSYPEAINIKKIKGLLEEKDIQVGERVVFEAGESEGETVAFFSYPASLFFELIDNYNMSLLQLSVICSAPIKVLCEWYETREVPDDAIISLKKHLGL